MRSKERTTKTKILVVDDEPDNLDLLYRTFHREYKVLRAESGPAALQILTEEGEVAVIISDQRMPQMSGTEFLSLTATQYPDIIRIILTGYTDVEDLVEAINAGKVFKYVTKPWKAEELRAIVKQGVDTHTVLKSRTDELKRALKQESLLYAVTTTIRSAPNYGQMLQRIVETVAQMLEADIAICSPCLAGQLQEEIFIYHRLAEPTELSEAEDGDACTLALENITAQTQHPDLKYHRMIWPVDDIVMINDLTTDENLQGDTTAMQQRREAYEQANIATSLILPLTVRSEVIAVLALHQCESRQWQDHEVQLLTTVVDQAALALSQARAYEQLRSLAQRETLVNTITNAIRSSLDTQEMFAAITEKLGQALQVDGCALSLWTANDQFVQCVGLYDAEEHKSIGHGVHFDEKSDSISVVDPTFAQELDHDTDMKSLAPIRGNPVLMQVLGTKKTVAINDLNEHPELNVADLPLRFTARALLLVPLIYDGKIIGSISLRQNNHSREWLPTEIDLAEVVASQAAIAVQQARLYQTTRQQAERLLQADRLKTEFFQNISHEFRTPLTLMIGPLESAVNQKQDLPFDQSSIALRNSRRLLRLVNQLLDMQKLDAGKMKPVFRPSDLVAFCRNIVESFSHYCERKDIHLVTDLDECPLIYLDTDRFDKVLYNLLSNAMKFTPAGGTISLSLKMLGDRCLLQVKDTGIGMKADQIPYLFERFRQAEGSASRSYEGTGLGLALVKELVELHGGQINVESVYGEGSSFAITLLTGNHHLPPDQVVETVSEFDAGKAAVEFADVESELTEKEELDDDHTEIQPILWHPETVGAVGTLLVVDDNPDLRSYVSRILHQANFNIIVARNGAEGIDMAHKYKPDVIITDLMMPVVSGLDLIKMVRDDQSLKGTPIILLTAKANEDTRIEGVELGADAYLSKPFNDRELLAEVKNLFALKENEKRVQELNKYLTESVLGRFLPPSMVQRAATGELNLDFEPEERLITVLFTDLVSFTQMSNVLQAGGIAELLNEYLGEMTRAIFENGGTVDKFVGDAVMALYGSPEFLEPQEQVRRAIASAQAMLNYLDRLNESWLERGLVGKNGVPLVRFRCGIHQGNAVVGMFGGHGRSDYTAIGPSVNMAARLQEVAEPSTILVSEIVAQYLEPSQLTAHGLVHLKGIDEPVSTYVVQR